MRIFGLEISRAREQKASPTWAAILASIGGQDTIYTPKDYSNITKAGYQACAPVFSVVSLILRSASRISWVVQRRGRDGSLKEIEKHRLQELLARPNEYMSGTQFIEAVMGYKLLAGNAYIHRIGTGEQPPRYLYTYRPDRMSVRRGDGNSLVGGYDYTVDMKKIRLKADEVLHLKDFHPLNDFYGLSRLEVSAALIDTMNWTAEWNLNMLQNYMQPPGLLKITGAITAEKQKLIEARLKDRYQGAENARKPLVIAAEQGIEWEQMSVTPKDMDWLEAEKFNLRRICAVFNVPSELLGDAENKTYSNVQEARKALYMETVLPEMDLLRDALQGWLVPLYGDDIVLDYDRDKIEALQEDREKKYAYIENARFLKINEKRAACGYEDIPEGDVILVGLGEMSLADAVGSPGDLSKGVRPLKRKSLGGFWRGDTARKALWQNFERRVVSKERAFMREAQAWLEAQGKSIVAAYEGGARTPEAMLDREEAKSGYKDRFSSRYLRLFATALAAGRSMTEGKLYDFADDDKATTDIPEPLRAKLEKLIEEAAEVITDETLAEVQAVLRAATGTNLTVQEIANALKDKLVDQMPAVRARRIARTETAMLENYGNLEGFKENEFVDRKGWLCARVEDSRDEHKAIDGTEIPMDELFRLADGSELEYPGDRRHGAAAGQTINCLCTLYPAVG